LASLASLFYIDELVGNSVVARKTKAVYPGTFDPVTWGHVDIITRALELFDTVYVAVSDTPAKTPIFSCEDRVGLIRQATKNLRRLVVETFDGLMVDYTRKKGASVIIRGLRATSDFDYEFQMAMTNRKLAGNIQTIFLIPSETHFYLSSSLIKEIARLGGELRDFVPPFVAKLLGKRLRPNED
jgi:pantetheine-phosphate adenylyltransferase